jgi:hypothetical protein
MFGKEHDCPFCGGVMRWSGCTQSFGWGESFSEHTCTTCKSRYRNTEGVETWHRSGHPLSFGYEAHPRRSPTPNPGASHG